MVPTGLRCPFSKLFPKLGEPRPEFFIPRSRSHYGCDWESGCEKVEGGHVGCSNWRAKGYCLERWRAGLFRKWQSQVDRRRSKRNSVPGLEFGLLNLSPMDVFPPNRPGFHDAQVAAGSSGSGQTRASSDMGLASFEATLIVPGKVLMT